MPRLGCTCYRSRRRHLAPGHIPHGWNPGVAVAPRAFAHIPGCQHHSPGVMTPLFRSSSALFPGTPLRTPGFSALQMPTPHTHPTNVIQMHTPVLQTPVLPVTPMHGMVPHNDYSHPPAGAGYPTAQAPSPSMACTVTNGKDGSTVVQVSCGSPNGTPAQVQQVLQPPQQMTTIQNIYTSGYSPAGHPMTAIPTPIPGPPPAMDMYIATPPNAPAAHVHAHPPPGTPSPHAHTHFHQHSPMDSAHSQPSPHPSIIPHAHPTPAAPMASAHDPLHQQPSHPAPSSAVRHVHFSPPPPPAPAPDQTHPTPTPSLTSAPDHVQLQYPAHPAPTPMPTPDHAHSRPLPQPPAAPPATAISSPDSPPIQTAMTPPTLPQPVPQLPPPAVVAVAPTPQPAQAPANSPALAPQSVQSVVVLHAPAPQPAQSPIVFPPPPSTPMPTPSPWFNHSPASSNAATVSFNPMPAPQPPFHACMHQPVDQKPYSARVEIHPTLMTMMSTPSPYTWSHSTPVISWDVTSDTSKARCTGGNAGVCLRLTEPATNPPVHRMKLRISSLVNATLLWGDINITPSSARPAGTAAKQYPPCVTIYDVLTTIHNFFHSPINPEQTAIMEKHSPGLLQRGYLRRVTLNGVQEGGIPDAQRGYLKVDALGDFTRFGGIRTPGPAEQNLSMSYDRKSTKNLFCLDMTKAR
ncbi:hypothetical protein HGRIS_011898 [Hohenbuehelia grisea]|uniref:DUF6699 domain-containing protein n=1 Tax=Hohenbuehelia grisea TaxID=104357 RepID=A0ABR3JXY0_9AGAR